MPLPAALTSNWPLKLTSLFLAMVLWLLAAAEEPTSRLVSAQIVVQAPPGRTVSGSLPHVTASVVGPARELLKLGNSRLLITKTVQDTGTGRTITLDLGPSDVALPRGINATVRDLQPRHFIVQLEPPPESLPGERRWDGVPLKLPAGLAGEMMPSQPTASVTLVGPIARLARLTADSLDLLLDGTDETRGDSAWGRLRVRAPAGLTGLAEPERLLLLRRRSR